jgi:UDP-3-O-[3-hydroxymyristoyl] glucosamine N-acyltransferase
VTTSPHSPATAVIAPSARIAEGVHIGQFSVIEPRARIGTSTAIGAGAIVESDVQIGAGCIIGHRVVLHAGCRLGDACTVHDGAILGRAPRGSPIMTHPVAEDHPPVKLAARCQVGANAVLYAGVELADDVLVGDLASIREGCTIGARSILGRGVMIEYSCHIGPGVKIQTGCYVTGETMIEEGAFLGPSVTMANDKFMDRVQVTDMRGPWIGRGARIGSNATLLPAVNLGDDCVIGAGAVVTHDVTPRTIVAGVPARILKRVPDDQQLMSRTEREGWNPK